MKVLAADIGFGYTKTTDGRQSQIFKSVLGEANEAPFTEALMSAQKQHPRHFKLGEESFFVGDLAETISLVWPEADDGEAPADPHLSEVVDALRAKVEEQGPVASDAPAAEAEEVPAEAPAAAPTR